MIINTMSEGISLAKKLESDSAVFFEDMARLHPEYAETCLAFVKENKKNFVQIERAYFGVITDAIEGCFAFNIDPDSYALNALVSQKDSLADSIRQAINQEETIVRYYNDAAKQCEGLMADIPRTFMIVLKKHQNRITGLKTILGNQPLT